MPLWVKMEQEQIAGYQEVHSQEGLTSGTEGEIGYKLCTTEAISSVRKRIAFGDGMGGVCPGNEGWSTGRFAGRVDVAYNGGN